MRKGETSKQAEERLRINRFSSESEMGAVSQEHPGLKNSPGNAVEEAT